MSALQRVLASGLIGLSKGVYRLRRAQALMSPARPRAHQTGRAGSARSAARRNILFITADQQRYDALRVNGGKVARTPVVDALARDGLNYRRAHVQNGVCMPSRATMLTGQYPRTHGVVANGIPLPLDAPSVAELLRTEAGYRTAIIGKAHFDPHLDLTARFFENRAAAAGLQGPWHGFEHLEFATHGPLVGQHYAAWLWQNHPDEVYGFGGVLTGAGGGDTGAPEVTHNPVAREHYHTDWVADRTIAWLSDVNSQRPTGGPPSPWFCWMSFPDPHHPFDPPLDEVRARIDWRDLELPVGHPGSHEAIVEILRDRPRHWLDWYEGRFRNPEGGSVNFVPARATADQLREVNAMIHVENELIDEACGRVLTWLIEQGLDADTDIFYTSDHGEMQGDYGLLYKGPYHVDSLLRVPLIWRPAPNAEIAPAEITDPVGHIDLAPTFCEIAGVEIPTAMESKSLPTSTDSGRQTVITTFDSQFAAVGMHLRTIYRAPYLCTFYEPRTYDEGGRFRFYWSIWGAGSDVPTYDGSEGELYHCVDDPRQWRNLFHEPAYREVRDALIDELRRELPPPRTPPLKVETPT